MSGVYGGFDNMMPAGMASTQSPQGAYRSAHDHVMNLNRDLHMYDQQFSKVLDTIRALVNEVEALHRHCDEVVSETQYLESTADQAEECVENARRIFERYTLVEDPVVASDGFTYERETITEYINNSTQEGITPLSYQTKEPLTSLLIPNRSLKSLLTRLEEQLRAQHPPKPAGSGAGGAPANHNHGPAAGGSSSNPNKQAGGHRGAGHGGAFDSGTSALPPGATHGQRDANGALIELNALGERVHPCIRIYGFCNYKDSCAYAKYPYDSCLSNLKGKCRFKNQCHERHVDFKGPLDDYGEPRSESNHHAAAKDGPAVPAPASAKADEKKQTKGQE